MATLSSFGTVGAVLLQSTTSVVEGSEVDAAGQQRRLSERVAYDVIRLQADPANDDIRAELDRTARQITTIRTGLLNGDLSIGLDGNVPPEFRELYSPDGLNLDRRLERLEQAAFAVAAAPSGATDPAALAAIAAEANGERLVRDLDVAVEALASQQARQASERQRTAIIGLFVSCTLGLFALVLLTRVGQHLRRQLAASDALVAEILHSEALHRATVDSFFDGVIIQNESGEVLRINQAALEMVAPYLDEHDASPSAQIASFKAHIFNEDGAPHTEFEPLQATSVDQPVVGRTIALRHGDDVSWFRYNSVLTESHSGSDRLVVTSFADITTERRLTAELAEQEHLFRTIIEHAPAGMAVVGLDGSFMTVNQALCDLTGYSKRELLEAGAFGLRHPDDRPFTEATLRALAAGDARRTVSEGKIIAAGGADIYVHVAMSVVRSESGKPPYFIIDFLDVTESRLAADAQADALAHEQEAVATLVALDQTRTDFLSTVAHELRTPLTSMIGYLEMLTDGAAGDLSAAQLKMLQAGTRSGERLGRLIDDLLALAAAERPDAPDRHDVVDIPDLLTEVIEAIAPMASSGEIALSTSIEATDAAVVGNKAELDRVLLNLIGNAVKYTLPGGDVAVSTAVSGDTDLEIEIKITDTGVGIPADEHDRLFTKFFRSSTAQTVATKGTGLGLVIAGRLIEAHGGRINLESAEGEGTTVTVWLPLRHHGDLYDSRALVRH